MNKSILASAVEKSHAPGAVAYVANLDKTLLFEAAGFRELTPQKLPAEKSTLYDLASLTKVMATANAIMLLRDEGELSLDQPVSEIVPLSSFSRFTIRQLLTHTSGLPALADYYKDVTSLDEYLSRIAAMDLLWKPGTGRKYSDLGFMILGKIVELKSGDGLDVFCRKRIFEPLGMRNTLFNPPEDVRPLCAATELCPWRKRVMIGQVHDENAYAVGGVSGHAGLFSNAEDIATFCRALLTGKILKEATLREMLQPTHVPFYPWQTIAWKIDPWASGSEGHLPSRTAFGHTGWTGTSIWMDYEKGCFAILLSNTCHPSRQFRDNPTLRRVFHTPVGAELYPDSTNTHLGLDRLMWGEFVALKGKRVAVLANAASIDTLKRPILDVLALEPSIHVVRVYSPEHGFSTSAEAGEKVGMQKSTSAPVVSLYGTRTSPTPTELKEIDTFVIDLQDVGARYYTYAATMKACLTACAETHTPVLVLDRPNPVGGTVLEGPLPETTDALVCAMKTPIRHGMTFGEIAMFLAKQPAVNASVPAKQSPPGMKLDVSTLDNWPPGFLFDQCSLPWIPPSPNIPTAKTALLYAGTCLFEGTNLNEGRGTETPFRMVGAPWLDATAIVHAVREEDRAGSSLEAVSYTPQSIPGKSTSPRFQNEVCGGIKIGITAPSEVRAFRLAVALLIAIHHRHPGEFRFEKNFDVLAGGPWLRQQIEMDISPSDIVKACQASENVYDALRQRLY